MNDQFHEYLCGNNFAIYTNNNPLRYVLTTARLDATDHHWIASLANYNFAINYKSGKTNVGADALSRVLWEKHDQCIEAELAQAIISNVLQGTALVEAYSCHIWVTA